MDILQKAREKGNEDGTSTSGSGSTAQELEKKCLMLQQQIHEMEVLEIL